MFDRLALLRHNQVVALCGGTALSREEGKERLDPYEEAQHLALCTSAEEAIQSVETLSGAPLAALATTLWREVRVIFQPVQAVQNGESSASLLPSQGPPTGGKVLIMDRPVVKKHQIAQDTLPVLSCLRGLQQATLAQRFPANDAAAYLYVVRAALSEGLLTTVDQRLSKFNVG